MPTYVLCIRLCMYYVCAYVCMNVYVYIYIYMYIYIYTYVGVFDSQIAMEALKTVSALIFRLFCLNANTNFRLIFTGRHDITTQNKRIAGNAAVKTSNLANI